MWSVTHLAWPCTPATPCAHNQVFIHTITLVHLLHTDVALDDTNVTYEATSTLDDGDTTALGGYTFEVEIQDCNTATLSDPGFADPLITVENYQ